MSKLMNLARSRFTEVRRKTQNLLDLAECKARIASLEKQLSAHAACKCHGKSKFARRGPLQMQNIPTDTLGNPGLLKLAEIRASNFATYAILVFAENEDTIEALVLLERASRSNGKYAAEIWVALDSSEDDDFQKIWHGQSSSGVGAVKATVEKALKALFDKANKQ